MKKTFAMSLVAAGMLLTTAPFAFAQEAAADAPVAADPSAEAGEVASQQNLANAHKKCNGRSYGHFATA